MALPLQNFAALVTGMANAVQAQAAPAINLARGSVLRAILEANAAVGLWMQWLIVQVLGITRAATSFGADLDTWMADFGVVRLPGASATGIVTLSRYTPSQPALVPPGTLTRTADGSQTFAVSTDTTNPSWSVAQNGYVIATGIASLDVPVAAVIAGSAGNVGVGGITLLVSATPGVDTVVNAAPITGGLDAESDAALRQRFETFVLSWSRATNTAIGNAVAGVQQGLRFAVQENYDPAGNPRLGYVTISVDDGAGALSSSVQQAVAAAVDAVRPVGVVCAVVAPTAVPVAIAMTVTLGSGVTRADIVSIIQGAVATLVTNTYIGAILSATKIAQVAYAVNDAVLNVSNVTINGVAGDFVPPAGGAMVASNVVVS